MRDYRDDPMAEDRAEIRDRQQAAYWAEYDRAAAWCARRGLTGAVGDPLPELMTPAVHDLINDDPEAFADRVRLTAYAMAMERLEDPLTHEDLWDRSAEAR